MMPSQATSYAQLRVGMLCGDLKACLKPAFMFSFMRGDALREQLLVYNIPCTPVAIVIAL
jgi:hypothetical protein